jgi:hypothetical protein
MSNDYYYYMGCKTYGHSFVIEAYKYNDKVMFLVIHIYAGKMDLEAYFKKKFPNDKSTKDWMTLEEFIEFLSWWHEYNDIFNNYIGGLGQTFKRQGTPDQKKAWRESKEAIFENISKLYQKFVLVDVKAKTFDLANQMIRDGGYSRLVMNGGATNQYYVHAYKDKISDRSKSVPGGKKQQPHKGSLELCTVAELKVKAAKRKISLRGLSKKTDIIAKLRSKAS